MIYYRLLRDNKETGPYSEQEMIAKGFKPYDLLWAEGKSAGWQYPSEISVFKKYAPIVEEQPYDRFYKKQPPQKLVTEERYTNRSYINLPAKTNEPVQQQQPVARPVYNYNTQDLSGRHIHVTLPSGNTLNLTTIVAKKENKPTPDTTEINNLPKDTENKPAQIPTEKIIAAKKPATVEDRTVLKQPAHSSTQAIAAIPDVPTIHTNTNTIVQPVYPAANTGFSWTLVLGAVIGVATMIGLGIMIGLSMNHEKNDIAFNEALRNRTKPAPVTVVSKPVVSVPLQAPASAADEPVPQHSIAPVKNKDLVQHALVKTTIKPENTIKEDKKLLVQSNPTPEKTNLVSHQEEVVQHPKPLPAIPAVNIEKSLSLNTNDFKTGAFGGISGLKCTLINGSKSPLESVEVQVEYIQANDKIYKTENLLFKDISAGAQATMDAPASSRGVKVIIHILKVIPREAALSNTTAKS